jgi:hypothetical protein
VNVFTFDRFPGQSILIEPAELDAVLQNGTNIELQATNNIAIGSLFENAGGGDLTLRANNTVAILDDVSLIEGSLSVIAPTIITDGVSIFAENGIGLTAGLIQFGLEFQPPVQGSDLGGFIATSFLGSTLSDVSIQSDNIVVNNNLDINTNFTPVTFQPIFTSKVAQKTNFKVDAAATLIASAVTSTGGRVSVLSNGGITGNGGFINISTATGASINGGDVIIDAPVRLNPETGEGISFLDINTQPRDLINFTPGAINFRQSVSIEQDVILTAGSVLLESQLNAGSNIVIDAVNGVSASGLDSGGDIFLEAGGDVTLGSITATNEISSFSGGAISVDSAQAGAILLSGLSVFANQLSSNDDIDLFAGANITVTGNVTLEDDFLADSNSANFASIFALDNIEISVGDTLVVSGELFTLSDIEDDGNIELFGNTIVLNRINSNDDIVIEANNITVAGNIFSRDDISISASTDLIFQDISANEEVLLQADSIQGLSVESGIGFDAVEGDLDIIGRNSLDIINSVIGGIDTVFFGGDAFVGGDIIARRGEIFSDFGGDLTVLGTVEADSIVSLHIAGSVDINRIVSHGVNISDTAVSVEAGGNVNIGSVIANEVAGLNVFLDPINLSVGSVDSTGGLELEASNSINITGALNVGTLLEINAGSGSVFVAPGATIAAADVTVVASQLQMDASQLTAQSFSFGGDIIANSIPETEIIVDLPTIEELFTPPDIISPTQQPVVQQEQPASEPTTADTKPATGDSSTTASTEPAQEDTDAAQKAIADGADPTELLAATAAGDDDGEIIILLEEQPLIAVSLNVKGKVCMPQ